MTARKSKPAAPTNDGLTNLASNLGTERDKAAHTFYSETYLDDAMCSRIYRYSWLGRKIVDIPAKDATRKWRNWNAEAPQIELIEAEEKRLGIKAKVLDCRRKARLFGGAGIFIGTGASVEQLKLPLDPTKLKKGGVKYLTVLTRRQMQVNALEDRADNENYGKPKFYSIPGGLGRANLDVHPSHFIVMIGAPLGDEDIESSSQGSKGWGDSIYASIYEAMKNSDSTNANVASLVFEAKVDVLQIPDFMRKLEDPQYEAMFLKRAQLAALVKGINGMLLLDKEEEYTSKTASFATLPDVMMSFIQFVSGAADIPLTRFLGTSPGGLGSNGEGELRNYYDGVSSTQELEMTPALGLFDECLLYSVFGKRPKDIYYRWAPLWQLTETQKADNAKKNAETIKTLADTGLFPDQNLSKAAQNLVIENDILPGYEIVEDFDPADNVEGDDGEDGDGNAVVPAEPGEEGEPKPKPKKVAAKDASPRTLYVSRRIVNADDIIAWAKAQGFTSTIPADDLHVTIAFSRRAVDWMKVGTDWHGDDKGELVVAPGGARLLEKLGENAQVLLFNSSALAWRHEQIKEAGASWDWPEYQPHITISYTTHPDLSKVEPYRGKIVLGPERFEALDENWKEKVKES